MLLLLNASDDVNDVLAPVDHGFIQTDVTSASRGADDALRRTPATIHQKCSQKFVLGRYKTPILIVQ